MGGGIPLEEREIVEPTKMMRLQDAMRMAFLELLDIEGVPGSVEWVEASAKIDAAFDELRQYALTLLTVTLPERGTLLADTAYRLLEIPVEHLDITEKKRQADVLLQLKFIQLEHGAKKLPGARGII